VNRPDELPQETDYKPTKGELFALFQYWWGENRWIAFEAWRDQAGINTTEWRVQVNANEHMARIEKIIGEEKAQKACERARQNFIWRIGEEDWRIWTEGTEEEVAEFHRKREAKWEEAAIASDPAITCDPE
jgi:hypothetical protein